VQISLLFTASDPKHPAHVAPLGSPVTENQPESGAAPIDALRLKLKCFKDRLSFPELSDSTLPDLPWEKEDREDPSALSPSTTALPDVQAGPLF